MKAIMMNGYFKGEEVELARPVPEYKFLLPKDNRNIIFKEITFEELAKNKPSIAIYRPQLVTRTVAYYKFARYE